MLLLDDTRVPGSTQLLQPHSLQIYDTLSLLQLEELADSHVLPPLLKGGGSSSMADTHDSACKSLLHVPAMVDATDPGVPSMLHGSPVCTPVPQCLLLLQALTEMLGTQASFIVRKRSVTGWSSYHVSAGVVIVCCECVYT